MWSFQRAIFVDGVNLTGMSNFSGIFMEIGKNSAQFVTEMQMEEMGWSDVCARLGDRQFKLHTRDVMREDAYQDYGLNADIQFERLSDKVYRVVVQPENLKGVHGWECPATLRFVTQTLASRVLFSLGCFVYRVALPMQELAATSPYVLHFQMQGDEMDSRAELPELASLSWSEPLASIPERPDLSRDLLKSGFSW